MLAEGGMLNLLPRRALPLAFFVWLIGVAQAHPTDDGLSRWYRSLKNHAGFSCCSEADCAPVDARQVGDEWQIFESGMWETVPAGAVLDRENPDGRPVACRFRGVIRCFVPQPGV
jgi:hypothetical protein